MKSVLEDIVRDILLKLPVKPLLRFKCLSKSWYSLISSPDFIKQHLHLSLHKKFLVDAIIEKEYMIDASYFNNLISGESTLITQPSKPIKHQYPFLDKHGQILCSCDGLLMIKTYIPGSRNFITLWNPSTRESRALPNSGYLTAYYALGYDSSTDDYKMIEEAHSNPGLSYQIFSLRSNSWRQIKDFKSDKIRLWDCSCINMNGAMHWLQPYEKSKIVCFTLGEETFIEIELPDDFGTSSNGKLFVLQGCLCLSETIYTPTELFCPHPLHSDIRKEYQSASLNVWLMKEYGVKDSWTKFITIPHIPINYHYHTYQPTTPFCFRQKAVFIIHQRYSDSSLVVYDLEEKDFELVEIEFYAKKTLTFVESLVSPNYKLN